MRVTEIDLHIYITPAPVGFLTPTNASIESVLSSIWRWMIIRCCWLAYMVAATAQVRTEAVLDLPMSMASVMMSDYSEVHSCM